MKAYYTEWKQGEKKGIYRTKSLTAFHKWIHDNPKTSYALTVETDSSVSWPFGLYGEVLAITDRKRNKYQPFPQLQNATNEI